MRNLKLLGVVFLLVLSLQTSAQAAQKVVDIPTRAGVTQRTIVLSPPDPKAAVVLFPGATAGCRCFPTAA